MASGSLVYVLAIALCALYTNETLLVAYSYRFHSDNPASSKLVFIAELVKLLLATCFFLSELGNAAWSLYQRLDDTSAALLPKSAKPQNGKGSHKAAAGYEELLQSDQVHKAVWEWVKAMAVFSVPAACYFVTNNLCIYALRVMPAHTYTLLSDLKIITTGVLSYLILDKHMNRSAGESLVLLFVGICLGQYGTSAGYKAAGSTAGAAAAATAATYPLLHDTLIMVLIAVLSAVAAVYTEWVMNHSAAYKHESINLQNMRLYASGTLFNGIYCLITANGSLTTVADMRVAHWFIVLGLAFMGLVTAVIIKRFGNIVKIYSSCIASLFAAGASAFILHDPPAPLFYLGCLMAMTATFQVQRARNQAAQAAAASQAQNASSKSDKTLNPAAGARYWSSTVGVPTIVSVVLVLLVSCQVTMPSGGPTSAQKSIVQGHTALPALRPVTVCKEVSPLGPTTDTPMPVLPPFAPTCIASRDNDMNRISTPILVCSKDISCTIDDPKCCMHLNWKLLMFFDKFMASKCLQDEYVLVHGTALGAIRNETILYHTPDVDLGVSLLGMQYLEMNSTKELFWRHGYVLYQYAVSGWWKVRPHLHHPDPAFRSAFRSYGENTDEYEKRNGDGFHVYIDVWPMWPVPANTTDCEKDLGIDPAPLLTVPWDSAFAELKKGSLEAVDTCSKAFEPASHSSGAQEQVYCKFFQATPLNITPGTRLAKMHNHSFPISTNYERAFVVEYGENWRTPAGGHGTFPVLSEGENVVDALLDKLSVTAWGDMPYSERKKQCDELRESEAASAQLL